jgi:hypothetical protein
MAPPKYTDNIDEKGHTLEDALREYPAVADWGWDTAVTLATSAAADDIIDTATEHGFEAGCPVYFPTLTGGTGLTAATVIYYVVATSLAAQTFRVALTPGGSAHVFSTDITAGTVRALSPETDIPLAGETTGMFPAQTDAEVDAQVG